MGVGGFWEGRGQGSSGALFTFALAGAPSKARLCILSMASAWPKPTLSPAGTAQPTPGGRVRSSLAGSPPSFPMQVHPVIPGPAQCLAQKRFAKDLGTVSTLVSSFLAGLSTLWENLCDPL